MSDALDGELRFPGVRWAGSGRGRREEGAGPGGGGIVKARD